VQSGTAQSSPGRRPAGHDEWHGWNRAASDRSSCGKHHSL